MDVVVQGADALAGLFAAVIHICPWEAAAQEEHKDIALREVPAVASWAMADEAAVTEEQHKVD